MAVAAVTVKEFLNGNKIVGTETQKEHKSSGQFCARTSNTSM